jgi:dual specificity tyrosine-phosphorylation-regulated kinase 2/3/4
MLSLGLPSLLKSSSRRSLHSDAKDSDKEVQQKAKAAAKEAEKSKNKSKKDDKDRSESRISVIINRRRGKVWICH